MAGQATGSRSQGRSNEETSRLRGVGIGSACSWYSSLPLLKRVSVFFYPSLWPSYGPLSVLLRTYIRGTLVPALLQSTDQQLIETQWQSIFFGGNLWQAPALFL
jgi:hypothetical protein